MNVFDKLVDTGVKRFIRIECPAVVDEDIEWQELPNGVKARSELLLAFQLTGVSNRVLSCGFPKR